MLKKMMLLLALCASISLAAQTTNANQAASTDQSSKKHKGDVTVVGCIAKQTGDYVLIQSDPGNTYQLEKSRKLHLAAYLGHQVEVTGAEFPSMSSSSDYLARSGVASPVTIRVHQIKSLASRCPGN